jgi:hypothetical protein
MRLAIAVLLALVPVIATATPVRQERPNRELRIVFLDGAVDVGQIVARPCGLRCATTNVKRRFRLRVDGRTPARFARVMAYVQFDRPGQRLRVDGRPLGTVPILIDAASPIGMAVAHTLEIEVPPSEPAGLVMQTIEWLVEESR